MVELTKNQAIKRSDFIIAPYLHRSNAKASWQVLITILPIAGLWILIESISKSGLSDALKIMQIAPSLVLLTLFSSRTFSLMHDCGHGSLFRTRWLNRLVGFFLGVINAIPQHPWSRDHAFHHRHNGDWEIYRGPIDVLTLEDYQELSRTNKFWYSVSRHWLMLFPGGFFYLVIKPRVALLMATTHFFWSLLTEFVHSCIKRDFMNLFRFKTRFKAYHTGYGDTLPENMDLFFNNLLVITSWVLMSRWLGFALFLTCYSLVMTASAAIFICIFFVQHNFKGSYANATAQWSSLRGAIEGSSNLNLPGILNWFLADISYHSIHHLCDRIPNYNLRDCHNRNKHLLLNARYLRIRDIPGCFKYILWDRKAQQLSTT